LFQKSEYKTYSTMILYMNKIFSLLIYFGVYLAIIGILFTIKDRLNICTIKIPKVIKQFSKMICMIMPVWFFMENFLPLYFSMIVEIQKAPFWNLKSDSLYYGEMSFGILLNVVYFIVFNFILLWFMMKFFKLGPESYLFFLKQDLNPKRRIWALLYYFDYFFFRTIVLLLFGLNDSVKSIALWYSVLALYLLSFVANLGRIYHSFLNTVVYCLNYVHVLIVILYFIIMHYIDNTDKAKVERRNKIF